MTSVTPQNGTLRNANGIAMMTEMPRTENDLVNHPRHYTKGGVECIDALDAATVGKPPDEAICVANVIKYLWRYEEKEPLRSLQSARWYLDRLIGKVRNKGLGKWSNQEAAT